MRQEAIGNGEGGFPDLTPSQFQGFSSGLPALSDYGWKGLLYSILPQYRRRIYAHNGQGRI